MEGISPIKVSVASKISASKFQGRHVSCESRERVPPRWRDFLQLVPRLLKRSGR